MSFTLKQLKDLETIIYFIPYLLSSVEITDEDKKSFFLISERGIYPKVYTDGIQALIEGKRWRGIHMFEMYEPGILDGSMPYIVILEGMPRNVVNFIKGELFKGTHAEIIEKVYQITLETTHD
mgnify:CR=1 FL=1